MHFCTYTVDIWGAPRREGRKNGRMVNFNEDEVFLDAVDHVVLVALETVGSDPVARFALFKALLAAAREATAQHARGEPMTSR